MGTYPRPRSSNAYRHRLTHDLHRATVCRVPGVPRQPDPDWIVDQRKRLGEQVRARRIHANLTQERLRDISGVERLTIQRIESGATDARYSWLLRIARALDIPVADLLRD